MKVVFQLGAFPPEDLDWRRLASWIGPANAAVARLDCLLEALPVPGSLLSILVTREAIWSSRLDGYSAMLRRVLAYAADPNPKGLTDEMRENLEVVLSCRRAYRLGEILLRDAPSVTGIIKPLHAELVKGRSRRVGQPPPGEFRKRPSHFGRPGRRMEYESIPPSQLPTALARWERYASDRNVPDKLVQIALLHAEFEVIHPFPDRNGQLGRILIPLWMAEKGLLKRPFFSIGAAFAQDPDAYFGRLEAVTRDGDWMGWCAYFLKIVKEQAEVERRQLEKILTLYEKARQRFPDLTHLEESVQVIGFLFRNPVFTKADFVAQGTVPPVIARQILKVLLNKRVVGVFREREGTQRELYVYTRLLEVVKGRGEGMIRK